MSKYGVFSGPYFPAFGLKKLRIWTEKAPYLDTFPAVKLYFKYEGNTKDVSFYEYIDSKELLNKIKINQIKFDDALKKQKTL